jgi:hypothetical protein
MHHGWPTRGQTNDETSPGSVVINIQFEVEKLDPAVDTDERLWLRYWQSFGQACAHCGRIFEPHELRRPYLGGLRTLRQCNRPCDRVPELSWL